VFILAQAIRSNATEQAVSVPSAVFMLLRDYEVLELDPVFLVVVLNPVPEFLDIVRDVESVLFFFVQCKSNKVLPMLTHSQLTHTRPSADNRG
jgi:hypothetical protein